MFPVNAAGVRLRPEEGAEPTVMGPTQRLLDAGIAYTARDCDECGLEIDQVDLTSCQACDAGPFHKVCLKQHRCPGAANLGMGGGLLLPPRSQTPTPLQAPTPVEESKQGSLLAGYGGSTFVQDSPSFGPSDPSFGSGESPLKQPRFATLEGAAAAFSSRGIPEIIHLQKQLCTQASLAHQIQALLHQELRANKDQQNQ